VLERLPPGVRRVRLTPARAQLRQRIGDQIGPQIGHPAQQHEAELPPRQTPHSRDPATMLAC
jgi:hypothetical protein